MPPYLTRKKPDSCNLRFRAYGMEYGYGDTVRYANSRVYSQGKLKKEAFDLQLQATHLSGYTGGRVIPAWRQTCHRWRQTARQARDPEARPILVRAFRRTSAGQAHRTGSHTAGQATRVPPSTASSASQALSSSNDGAVLVLFL
jgi:hypothetical protein